MYSLVYRKEGGRERESWRERGGEVLAVWQREQCRPTLLDFTAPSCPFFSVLLTRSELQSRQLLSGVFPVEWSVLWSLPGLLAQGGEGTTLPAA